MLLGIVQETHGFGLVTTILTVKYISSCEVSCDVSCDMSCGVSCDESCGVF